MNQAVENFYADIKKSQAECPWFREQKIKDFLSELESEIIEARAALEKKDDENLKEEIGDILWDALSLIAVAEKEKNFDAKEMISGANKKLRRRKPYVFSGMKIRTKEEAVKIWNDMKKKEKMEK